MKVYKISRGTVKLGAQCDIGVVELRKTPAGYCTLNGRRIPALNKPIVKVDITVYSASDNLVNVEWLCARIRAAIEEYGGRNGKK